MTSDTDVESSDEKASVASIIKRTGPLFSSNWILETKFPNEKSALGQLYAEKTWSMVPDTQQYNSVQEKTQVNYRCNRANYMKPCPVMKCLYYPKNRKEVWMYKTKTKHSHNLVMKKRNLKRRLKRWKLETYSEELENDLKIRIIQLMRTINSPTKMLLQLESEGFDVKTRVREIRGYYAQKKYNKWTFEKSFKTVDECKMYMSQEQIWSTKRSYQSIECLNYYFRCSLVPSIGEQCGAQKLFKYNKQKHKGILYTNNSPHTHQEIITGLDMCPSTETDLLLNQLSNSDQKAVKKQDFRVLNAVNLQNCLTNPTDYNIRYLPNWIFEDKFLNEQLAQQYLAKDNIWSFSSENICTSGRRIVHFRCNRLRLLKFQCNASKCLLYSTESEEILVYKKDTEHTHDKIAEQTRNNLQMYKNRYPVTSKRRIRAIGKEININNVRLYNSKTNLEKDDHINSVKVSVNNSQTVCENIKSEYDSKWVYENTFATTSEANSYLKSINLGYVRTNTFSISFYRCDIVQNSGLQCNAQAYTIKGANTDNILVYRNMAQHTHDKIINTNMFESASKSITKTTLQSENVVEKENDNDSVLFSENGKWKLETSITDGDMVLDYLYNEDTWRCKSQNDDDSKVFYCCIKNTCKAEMCLTYKKLSNEILVYRSGDHTHYVNCESKDLPAHFNETKLIIDSYPNSNIIVKEELIIDAEPVVITGKEYDPSYSEENEINSEINVPLIEQHDVSLEDETTNNLNLDKSSECTYVSPVFANSDNESLSGDKLVKNLEEWQYETVLSDNIIAKEYMDYMNLISCISRKTKCGVKQYYKCKSVDKNVKNCFASHYLLFKDTSTIIMYKRNIRHADNCTNISFAMISIEKDLAKLIDLDDSSVNDENLSIEKTFQTIEKAIQYIKNQQIWYFKFRIKLEEGCKEYYRCSLLTDCITECDAKKLLLINYKTNVISLYKNKSKHTHSPLSSLAEAYKAVDKFDYAIKNKIGELLLNGVKPMQILVQLKQDFKVTYTKNLFYWIKNARENLRKDFDNILYFNKTITNWLSQITRIPVYEDTYYCVNFDVDKPPKSFRCFLSTRRLLNNAVSTNILRIDSTCMLQLQHNIVSIVGTIDLDQTFHLIGVAICSDAKKRDYSFIINSIQKGVQTCYNTIFKPECLISDENEDIHNVFSKMFGLSSKIHMCSQVALTKIMCKLSACVKLDMVKKPIEEDIRKIQKLSTNTLFYKAIDLFSYKWRRLIPNLSSFINYFISHWVIKNPNWVLGFCEFTPHIKKAIDAEYDTLKNIYKFEKNLPIGALETHIKIAMKKLESFSLCYASGGSKKFVYNTTISRSIYIKAANWINLEQEIKRVQGVAESKYYFSVNKKSICKEEFQKYLKCEHETLEEFFDIQFSFWCVQKVSNSITLRCNCPPYLENFVCEHSVGMAKMLNLVKFPSDIERLILVRQPKFMD